MKLLGLMLPIFNIELPFLAEREVPKIHRFYEQLLFNVESLETPGKLNTVEGATYYVVKKLEVIKAELVAHVETNWRDWTFRDLVNALRKWTEINIVVKTQNCNKYNQRRSEDYTGMQRGQTRFFTYYRFLALRRHCSVGFRCVYTSSFREIQKRIYRKNL